MSTGHPRPLVFPLLKTPFLNPRQVCAAVRLAACPRLLSDFYPAAVRLRRVLAYFLTFTSAAVLPLAASSLNFVVLEAYSCDSEDNNQNIEH